LKGLSGGKCVWWGVCGGMYDGWGTIGKCGERLDGA